MTSAMHARTRARAHTQSSNHAHNGANLPWPASCLWHLSLPVVDDEWIRTSASLLLKDDLQPANTHSEKKGAINRVIVSQSVIVGYLKINYTLCCVLAYSRLKPKIRPRAHWHSVKMVCSFWCFAEVSRPTSLFFSILKKMLSFRFFNTAVRLQKKTTECL